MAKTTAIDLGRKPDPKESAASPAQAADPSPSYPSVHIHNAPDMENIPDGPFDFHGKGKIVHRGKNTRDGKTTYSHEMEIHSIKHVPSGKSSDGLESALEDIAKKKSK